MLVKAQNKASLDFRKADDSSYIREISLCSLNVLQLKM